MSIANEISRIQSAKTDIRTAIELKGVTVPSSATIDTYDTYVSQISGGGGVQMPSKLDAITLSDYGLITSATIKSGETSIGDYAFDTCVSLTSVTIPNSVTSIGEYAFADCGNIGSVVIPSGVTSIGDYAFGGCGSLSGVTCLATTPPTLAIGSDAFGNANNYPIYVPAESVEAYKSSWIDYSSRIQAIPS